MKKYLGAFKKRNKWKAAVTINREQIHLGTYRTELEAAKAYDAFIIVNNHNRKINNVPLYNDVNNIESRDMYVMAHNDTKQLKASKEFVKKANKVHNNQYTYDKTKYTLARNKVIVTCSIHGDFTVTANNHLKGKGCPDCAKLKTGWNKSRYTNVPTILYVVLVDRTFYKIGITKKSIKERYAHDRLQGLQIETMHEHCFIDGADAFDIEKILLRKTAKDKYKGTVTILPHGGDTELRTSLDPNLFYQTIKEYYDNN